MSARRRLGRRALLRGMGGAMVGLPFLASLEERAHAATDPKRLLIVFTGNGTVWNNWKPSGTETSFTLPTILQPLAPFQSDLIVFHGLDLESSYDGPGAGDAHARAMASLLTGVPHVDTPAGPGTAFPVSGGGISIDQFLAQQLGGATKFPSLELGVQSSANPNVWGTLSYLGADQPVVRERDPVAMFDRLFGDLSGDIGEMQALRAQRHSVLDLVSEELTALGPRLGQQDALTLEAHLEAVRELEKSIDLLGNAQCTPPTLGPIPADLTDTNEMGTIGKMVMDMAVMALACDLTRVMTLQWRGGLGGGAVFGFLGQTDTHHDISHMNKSDPLVQQQLTDIDVWYAQQFSYLLSKLQSTQEISGASLLDNCAVLWVHELSEGQSHSRRNMPMVLAGSCQGFFDTGRYLQFGGRPHNDLLISLCHAMDVGVSTFGDPVYCSGPIAQLQG